MFLFHHLFFKSQHLLWLLSDTFMYRCKHAASTLFNSVKELGIVEVYLKMMVLHRNVSQMWQCDEIGLDINSKSLQECACLYFSLLGWGSQIGFHLSAVCYEKNTWKAKILGDNAWKDFSSDCTKQPIYIENISGRMMYQICCFCMFWGIETKVCVGLTF